MSEIGIQYEMNQPEIAQSEATHAQTPLIFVNLKELEAALKVLYRSVETNR
jgi:hypothetical protein